MNAVMTSILNPRFSLALAAAALLTACPGGGATTVTAGESTGDESTAGPDTTTVEPTTVEPTTVEPTTGEPENTTVAVDPCEACSPDATCKDGACTCKDGYDGDGATCDDIDECGVGQDNCSPDAECTNTPGGFTCACGDGYDGDGFDCKDVDECDAPGLNNCSPLADCANEDGSFECTCKEGYEGDGVSCKGNKPYGDACELPDECASGLCLGQPYNACTVQCSVMVAHDCRDQGLSGLCVATSEPDLYVCAGDFNGGPDEDDSVLQAGDSAMRTFQNQTDADVFLIVHPAQDVGFVVSPDPDDNVALDVYDIGGGKLGTIDAGAIGFNEQALLEVQEEGMFYVVVRNIGNSNGSYTIETMLQ